MRRLVRLRGTCILISLISIRGSQKCLHLTLEEAKNTRASKEDKNDSISLQEKPKMPPSHKSPSVWLVKILPLKV